MGQEIEKTDRLTSLKSSASFFGDLKTVWTAISAIVLAAYFVFSTIEDYKRRFEAEEGSTKTLTQRFNSNDERLSSTVSRVEKLEQARLAPDQSIKENRKVAEILSSEPASPAGLSGLQGGTPYTDTNCPLGQYVAGIKTTGAPGSVRYCVGCIISVQAICRELPK